MDARPFYDGLKFRGVPDTLAQDHVEGSECCLIHADNSLSRTKGVWVNPNVRVGYCHNLMHVEPQKYADLCHMAYDDVHARSSWMTGSEIFLGLWKNRLLRWFTTDWFRERSIARTVDVWQSGHSGEEERGSFCLVDELQVIRENGWVSTVLFYRVLLRPSNKQRTDSQRCAGSRVGLFATTIHVYLCTITSRTGSGTRNDHYY